MYTFFYFLLYTINVQIKRGVKIMEIKRVLNLLNNQYCKSLKRYEKQYGFMSDFNEQIKEFNNDYLKIVSAVLSGKATLLDLNANWVYTVATFDEKEKL